MLQQPFQLTQTFCVNLWGRIWTEVSSVPKCTLMEMLQCQTLLEWLCISPNERLRLTCRIMTLLMLTKARGTIFLMKRAQMTTMLKTGRPTTSTKAPMTSKTGKPTMLKIGSNPPSYCVLSNPTMKLGLILKKTTSQSAVPLCFSPPEANYIPPVLFTTTSTCKPCSTPPGPDPAMTGSFLPVSTNEELFPTTNPVPATTATFRVSERTDLNSQEAWDHGNIVWYHLTLSSQNRVKYQFLFPTLWCNECCFPNTNCILEVGDNIYITANMTANKWYDGTFISSFSALAAHYAHLTLSECWGICLMQIYLYCYRLLFQSSLFNQDSTSRSHLMPSVLLV